MIIIRPTASLAKKCCLKLPAQSDDEVSTARLGDWSAIDLVLTRLPHILCVSHSTRLPVVLRAALYANFAERLPAALSNVLKAIGLSSNDIESELEHMRDIRFAKTNDRSVLGTLNEFKATLKFYEHTGRFAADDTTWNGVVAR